MLIFPNLASSVDYPKFPADFHKILFSISAPIMQPDKLETSLTIKGMRAEYRKSKKCGDFFSSERVADSSKLITQAEELHRELEVSKLIGSHPNLVNLHNGKFFGKYAFAEYEPLTMMTSLRQFIKAAETHSENQVRSITKQLIPAVSHIHARGFVHGNINPDNIFVKTTGHDVQVKLGCVGSSREQRSSNLLDRPKFDSFWAPEIKAAKATKRDLPATIFPDSFSLGAVVSFMLQGELHLHQSSGLLDISNFRRLSSSANEFIECLCREVPETRFSVARAEFLSFNFIDLPETPPGMLIRMIIFVHVS